MFTKPGLPTPSKNLRNLSNPTSTRQWVHDLRPRVQGVIATEQMVVLHLATKVRSGRIVLRDRSTVGRAFKSGFSVNQSVKTQSEVVPTLRPRKLVATLPMLFANLCPMVNPLLLLQVSQIPVQLVCHCWEAQSSKGRSRLVFYWLAQVNSR